MSRGAVVLVLLRWDLDTGVLVLMLETANDKDSKVKLDLCFMKLMD